MINLSSLVLFYFIYLCCLFSLCLFLSPPQCAYFFLDVFFFFSPHHVCLFLSPASRMSLFASNMSLIHSILCYQLLGFDVETYFFYSVLCLLSYHFFLLNLWLLFILLPTHSLSLFLLFFFSNFFSHLSHCFHLLVLILTMNQLLMAMLILIRRFFF